MSGSKKPTVMSYYAISTSQTPDDFSDDISHDFLDDDRFVFPPENADSFLSHHLYSGALKELVPTSVKLPKAMIDCIDNNSQVLGMSKSDFHRKALEIGINEITQAWERQFSDQPADHIVDED